ncbi:MAG: LPXTG cell wall anchor domain-containing protein [Actinobacteria bacterium]|nr:LPXTG cell wall anchor domain-containing protein [Actinomycetota bacterium]
MIVATVGLFGFALSQRDASGQPKASVSIEQCANANSTCDSASPSNWVTGNLNRNNSSYPEGNSVPYRAIISGLVSGETYAVRIEWDSTESIHHALDFLTDFDRTESGADPCAGVTCGTGPATLGIPSDPNVVAGGVTPIGGQAFHLWGGSFAGSGSTVSNLGNLCAGATCTIGSNPSAYLLTGDYTGSSKTSLELYFTASSPTVVLAWGGHVATQTDWGLGKSASALQGSPYHMRVVDFRCSDAANCSAGNQDLSMRATAVDPPASTTTTTPGTTTTTTAPGTTTTTTVGTTTTTPGTTTTTAPGTTTTTLGTTTTTTRPTSTTAPATTNPGVIFFPTQIPEITQGSDTTRTLPPNEDSDGPDGVTAEQNTDVLPATGSSQSSLTLLGLALVFFAVGGLVILAIRPEDRPSKR